MYAALKSGPSSCSLAPQLSLFANGLTGLRRGESHLGRADESNLSIHILRHDSHSQVPHLTSPRAAGPGYEKMEDFGGRRKTKMDFVKKT